MKDQKQDPIVCYLVVRESLGMTMGKMAVQCCHGIQYVLEGYYGWKYTGLGTKSVELVDDWIKSGHRKVVLKADEKEWKQLEELSEDHKVVIDAGLTQLEPGTSTVIAFFPMRKSQCPKIIKRLQVL